MNNQLTDERLEYLSSRKGKVIHISGEELANIIAEIQGYRKAKCQHKWEVKDWHQTHSIEQCVHCGELRTGRGNY